VDIWLLLEESLSAETLNEKVAYMGKSKPKPDMPKFPLYSKQGRKSIAGSFLKKCLIFSI